ncbi:hypothetical protein, partial [Actinomadura nitritigenes]|uniref:hypothetical protein n=1 Tax=Actinomadura nitritigenes TaxID=134602 RepID=UPI0031E2CBEE
PTYGEEVAPAGQQFVDVTLEIKGQLTDRPTVGPNPDLFFEWSACKHTVIGCLAKLERKTKYLTYAENAASEDGNLPPASYGELLAPGTAYVADFIGQVPQSVPVDSLKICPVQSGNCIPTRELWHPQG